MAMIEQRLPRGQPGLWERSGFDEVQCPRLGRPAPHLDGAVHAGPPAAVAVDEAIPLAPNGYAGRAVAERDDHTRALVGGDERPAVMPVSVGADWPGELGWGEAGSAYLHERV